MAWYCFIEQPHGLEAVEVLEKEQDLNRFLIATAGLVCFLSEYEVDPYMTPAVCCYAKADSRAEAESLARNIFRGAIEVPDSVPWYEPCSK